MLSACCVISLWSGGVNSWLAELVRLVLVDTISACFWLVSLSFLSLVNYLVKWRCFSFCWSYNDHGFPSPPLTSYGILTSSWFLLFVGFFCVSWPASVSSFICRVFFWYLLLLCLQSQILLLSFGSWNDHSYVCVDAAVWSLLSYLSCFALSNLTG